MKKDYLFGVYIGRFQPFHLGHLTTLRWGLQKAEQILLILGSDRTAPSVRNPWSAGERRAMIETSLTAEELTRTRFLTLPDYPYDDARWGEEARRLVTQTVPSGATIALLGHEKDSTSFYLRTFPEWDFLETGYSPLGNGTEIRQAYFEGASKCYEPQIPPGVAQFLREFRAYPRYALLREEYRFLQGYRQAWSAAPYPPILVTVDAVVIQGGRLLTIRRRRPPGQGLLALPGGFLEPEETLAEGLLRELGEETALAVSSEALRQCIVASAVFDAPGRSLRGRTITHAYCLRLPGEIPAPVAGQDDAETAQWLSLERLTHYEAEFFEDHYAIVQHFLP
ncbi:MAG: bifunctional nicotinamide-nucleotide adenylyltransferase/Nudix hydroxylase [Cyanobacteriota bacterium]|nr:bifunctional nicotinamide-nucleotide adenylyltransferase/Nudix hydroxylase [Cyanobacteriota bacterium]